VGDLGDAERQVVSRYVAAEQKERFAGLLQVCSNRQSPTRLRASVSSRPRPVTAKRGRGRERTVDEDGHGLADA
jgi:hypothetical protein